MFDINQFKNIGDVKAVIDFSDLYDITRFELGFNHIGVENGTLVIGGVYSVTVVLVFTFFGSFMICINSLLLYNIVILKT